jgi:hypothetical protein
MDDNLFLNDILVSSFAFFFGRQKGLGYSQWHKRLAYFLVDPKPIGILVLVVT